MITSLSRFSESFQFWVSSSKLNFFSPLFLGRGGPCLAGALNSFPGSTPLALHPWGHLSRWPPTPPIREVGSDPRNDEPCLIVGRKRTEAGKEWKNFLLADKQLLLVATNGKSIFTLLCPSKGVDLHDTKKPSAKNWKRAFLFGNYKLKIGNHTMVFQVMECPPCAFHTNVEPPMKTLPTIKDFQQRWPHSWNLPFNFSFCGHGEISFYSRKGLESVGIKQF